MDDIIKAKTEAKTEAIRALNEARMRFDGEAIEAALAELGNPSDDELTELAITGLADSDRNVRVQMLRLVAGQRGSRAAEGILTALNDPIRRVRRQAAKLSGDFVTDPAVEQRLKALALDEDEIPKIRSGAFAALSTGKFLASLAESPAEARRFFEDVPELARYRQVALNLLVAMDPLEDDARELLRYVVETGSKEEAVAATRALCGFKVVHIGAFSDPKEIRRVKQSCDRAHGSVFYWVPRAADPG